MSENITLGDLGEREIVRRILPRYCVGVGSDCAVVGRVAGQAVLTTDPVPRPAAEVLGGDPDLYWMGWLLVTINASDLAAAGARPLAFLAAVEAPTDLPLSKFERMLLGAKEACESEGLAYAGGNLREGPALAAVGSALGASPGGVALTRVGASLGDLVVSVGAGGVFWRDALRLRMEGARPSKLTSPIFRPRSQLRVMGFLRERGLVEAAIDNSDGLIPSLQQLSEANSLAIRLDLDGLVPAEGSSGLGVDPARLWLGWGDWNVICAVKASRLEDAGRVALRAGGAIYRIGEFVVGAPEVRVARGGEVRAAPRLESERFARDSWFRDGIEGYVRRLLEVPLPG